VFRAPTAFAAFAAFAIFAAFELFLPTVHVRSKKTNGCDDTATNQNHQLLLSHDLPLISILVPTIAGMTLTSKSDMKRRVAQKKNRGGSAHLPAPAVGGAVMHKRAKSLNTDYWTSPAVQSPSVEVGFSTACQGKANFFEFL
jgi:hypothetical protein